MTSLNAAKIGLRDRGLLAPGYFADITVFDPASGDRLAMRETLEEACATVELGRLFASVDVIDAGQVHFFFEGKLVSDYGVGEESLEVSLFSEDEIPWDDIAFHSGHYALKKYFEDRGRNKGVHVHELRRAKS